MKKSSPLNEFFDQVYLLNLKRREDRLQLSKKRLEFVDLHYDTFQAVDGSVLEKMWKEMKNPYFKNPSYLGCAVSHLSIYKHAVEKGYSRILILEDDCRINTNLHNIFDTLKGYGFIEGGWDLLYLGFIPLSDDQSMWDYNVLEQPIITREKVSLVKAKNFWGLYSYGISNRMMKEVLEVYEKDFPMELDRYFVEKIQPRKNSYGVTPQLFAADDGYSDNSKKVENNMLLRSIDTRFANLTDYI